MKAFNMNKLYSIFAVLLAVRTFAAAKESKVSWMYQKLDHCNISESRMWHMRYLANDEFYQPGGPLFIFVGAEGPLSPSNIGNGTQIYRLAKEHHGYLFHTEHRFYGENRPIGSMTNENLKYLNSTQAVSDLARFILHMNNIHGMKDSKVILVGCSIGGTLATWFKSLYPDFAHGVWASSATLLAKTDLSANEVLAGETIRKVGGIDCYNRIKGGIAELEEMLENKRGADIKAIFRLCNSFNETNNLDVATLFFEISDIFFSLITNHGAGEIQKECSKLMHGISDLVALGYYIAQKLGGSDCNEVSYSSILNHYKKPSADRSVLSHWTYHSCHEFGWFKPASSPSQIFGTKLPLDYFFTLCADIYGEEFTKEYIEKSVEETNNRFGGLTPDVENVYWTNGGLDLYRLLSIQTGPHATVIPNLSHCADLHEITPGDSPELKASREKLEGLVKEWLA